MQFYVFLVESWVLCTPEQPKTASNLKVIQIALSYLHTWKVLEPSGSCLARRRRMASQIYGASQTVQAPLLTPYRTCARSTVMESTGTIHFLSIYFGSYPLTLTTFRFPFCAPPAPGAPAPTAAGPSVAFIPAFTVSIRTPVEIAGEYCETRLAKGGCGSGGTGSCRPEICLGWGAAGALALVVAGCFPLLDEVGTLICFSEDSETSLIVEL